MCLESSHHHVSLKDRSIKKLAEIEKRELKIKKCIQEVEFTKSFLASIFENLGFGNHDNISMI